jgi:hypothetical protein
MCNSIIKNKKAIASIKKEAIAFYSSSFIPLEGFIRPLFVLLEHVVLIYPAFAFLCSRRSF